MGGGGEAGRAPVQKNQGLIFLFLAFPFSFFLSFCLHLHLPLVLLVFAVPKRRADPLGRRTVLACGESSPRSTTATDKTTQKAKGRMQDADFLPFAVFARALARSVSNSSRS